MQRRGQDARRVKRAQTKLYKRKMALMKLARLFGCAIEDPEDLRTYATWLRAMTPDERAEHARDVLTRAKQTVLEYQRNEAAAVTDAAGNRRRPPRTRHSTDPTGSTVKNG